MNRRTGPPPARQVAAILAVFLAVSACAASEARPTAPTPPPATTAATVPTTTTSPPPTTSSTTTTTTTPTTTTTTTTTTVPIVYPPERGRLVIHGTGDVNLDPSYIRAFRTEGYDYAWTGLGGLFQEDDLTIVNLECAASPLGRREPKTFTFRCDTVALTPMREAGVEVASLGNNHSRDFGAAALVDSRRTLRAAGIAAVGAGRNEVEAHAPALFEINGWKIAVLGFGGVVPNASWFAGPDHPGMADGDTIETMVAAVQAADEIADLVFVTIHWGVELDTKPRPGDIARAEAMIDAGADGIFGHHAHRLGPLGWYAGRPIAWGLGNFVWPRFSRAGATTAVAEFVVEPDGTISACLIPVLIERSGHPVLQVEHVEPCGRSDTIPARSAR